MRVRVRMDRCREHRPDLVTSKARAPEWAKLHSDWRFFQALFCYVGPPSHILWNIKWPFTFVMLVACMVALFEHFRVDEEKPPIDPNGTMRDCFRLTSYAMALLLTFRVQRSYERWNQARSSMAGVGNGATTIYLLATQYIQDPAIVDDFRRFCLVWPYAIMQACTLSKTLDPRAAKLLHPEEMELYMSSRKGRQVVVTKVRSLAYEANLATYQAINIENAIAMTWKSAGDALRIRFQAMPHGLTLMCTGFVQLWCILLPIALWSTNNTPDWPGVGAMAFVSVLLLGADEMAHQMEDPFAIMPLDDIMVTYDRDINRVLDETNKLRAVSKITRTRKIVLLPGEDQAPPTPAPNVAIAVGSSSDIALSQVRQKSLQKPANSQQALLLENPDNNGTDEAGQQVLDPQYMPPVKVP